jgi:uncharacterized protein YggE
MLKVAGALALVCLAPAVASAAESGVQAPPGSIRVVASATVSAKPDQAEIVLGVTTFQKTASAAVAENEKRMERLLAALKKEIGTDGEVSTSEFSVRQEFVETRSGDTTPKIRGYRVTNTVQARAGNVSAVGRLLDAALQAGANNVEQVGFTLKDPETARNQALRLASVKARARAAAIAEGQGLHVGEVISMTEGEGIDAFDKREVERFKMVSANVSIESGSLEVTGTVTVTFALKSR